MLYLASQSPRRRELLKQINIPFKTVHGEIDETVIAHESADDYVIRMAQSKAQAGLKNTQEAQALVMGADTAVVFEDQIFGKPDNAAHAASLLRQLSGSTHWVMSGVSLASRKRQESIVQKTQVSFRVLSDHEIHQYCLSDEPYDKAGAYAIQGRAAVFISNITGSYSSVMGLPLMETWKLLESFDAL